MICRYILIDDIIYPVRWCIIHYISQSMKYFKCFYICKHVWIVFLKNNIRNFLQPAVRLWWQRLPPVWEVFISTFERDLTFNRLEYIDYLGVIFCYNWSKGSSQMCSAVHAVLLQYYCSTCQNNFTSYWQRPYWSCADQLCAFVSSPSSGSLIWHYC